MMVKFISSDVPFSANRNKVHEDTEEARTDVARVQRTFQLMPAEGGLHCPETISMAR